MPSEANSNAATQYPLNEVVGDLLEEIATLCDSMKPRK